MPELISDDPYQPPSARLSRPADPGDLEREKLGGPRVRKAVTLIRLSAALSVSQDVLTAVAIMAFFRFVGASDPSVTSTGFAVIRGVGGLLSITATVLIMIAFGYYFRARAKGSRLVGGALGLQLVLLLFWFGMSIIGRFVDPLSLAPIYQVARLLQTSIWCAPLLMLGWIDGRARPSVIVCWVFLGVTLLSNVVAFFVELPDTFALTVAASLVWWTFLIVVVVASTVVRSALDERSAP